MALRSLRFLADALKESLDELGIGFFDTLQGLRQTGDENGNILLAKAGHILSNLHIVIQIGSLLFTIAAEDVDGNVARAGHKARRNGLIDLRQMI